MAARNIYLLTGGTSGIGLSAATTIAQLDPGSHLLLVGRDPNRGQSAATEVASHGATAEFVQADLSLIADNERVAQRALTTAGRLRAFVPSAGIVDPKKKITADGLDWMFATYYVSRYILARRLLPALRSHGDGRIATVGAKFPPKFSLNFVEDQQSAAYRFPAVMPRVMLSNFLLHQQIATTEGPSGVKANIMHPGIVVTNIMREMPAPVQWAMRAAAPLLTRVEVPGALAARLAAGAVDFSGCIIANPARIDSRRSIAAPAEICARYFADTEAFLARKGVRFES